MARGRPPKNFDEKQYQTFESLMEIGCTEQEVCSVLNVTDKTLNLRLMEKYEMNFSDMHKRGMFTGKLKVSLRRAQIKSALGGNVVMQIFMGKQLLAQKDHADLDISMRQYEGVPDSELESIIKDRLARLDVRA